MKVLTKLQQKYLRNCLLCASFCDLEKFLEVWKDEHYIASTMDPIQNVDWNTMEAKFEFSECLNGQGGCYPNDWKRFLRNMEFDNADIDRMNEYGDLNNMVAVIDYSNDKLEDKSWKMLEELHKIKGGALCWAQIKAVLERILRSDCVDALEGWLSRYDSRENSWGN